MKNIKYAVLILGLLYPSVSYGECKCPLSKGVDVKLTNVPYEGKSVSKDVKALQSYLYFMPVAKEENQSLRYYYNPNDHFRSQVTYTVISGEEHFYRF